MSPRLLRHLRPHVVPGDAVYLLAESGATVLRGAHVEIVVPLLDGTRSTAEIAAGTGVPAERIDELVRGLTGAGLVRGGTTDGAAEAKTATHAYWDAAGLDADGAVRRITAARIGVRALPGIPRGAAGVLRAALERSGARTADGSGPADLEVVLCADQADPALAATAAELRGTPWLLVSPAGSRIAVGPVLGRGGACWHCLAAQLLANRPVDAHLRAAGSVPVRPVVEPPVPEVGVQVAALEALKWVAGHRYPGQDQVWTFDTLTLETGRHAVRRLPQCPSCGDPDLVRSRAAEAVVLGPAPVRSRSGGYRTLRPAEVLARYGPLVSPLTGVVTDVWRDPACPDGVNVCRAGFHPVPGTALDAADLRSAARGESGGKGVTAIDAEVSALCEALERRSGTFHGDEAMEVARYAELGERAVNPDACRLQDPRQTASREGWNAAHGPFQHVATAFDDQAELPWTPVWSLTRQRHRLLPTGMLYFGAPGPESVAADSNGCAAGTSLTDAVLQGLLEVVERDAVALWWYNRSQLPGVDLRFAEPWVQQMRSVHADLDRELWVLDLTADLGIPVFAALSRRTTGSFEDVLFGFGAHLDPAIALRRAVTEVNQAISGLGDLQLAATEAGGDPDLAVWAGTVSCSTAPWLASARGEPLREPGHHRHARPTDLATDVADVVERIEAAGMEVLVLDQTRPDIGLPVARVIVPGMRHYWARFAPGRLFDVPVRLGRLTAPTAYADLNPIPVFL